MSHLLSFPAVRVSATLLLSALLGPRLAAEPGPDRIPVEDLMRPYAVNEARLSFDGHHLGAVSTDEKGVRSLLVLDLATRKPETLRLSSEYRDIGTVRWLTDREIVLSDGSAGQYAVALYYARLGNLRNAVRFSSDDLTSIVGLPRARPDRALVWISFAVNRLETPNRLVEMSVKVSAKRGESKVAKTFAPPADGVPIDWIALENGELGYCVTYRNKRETLHRYDAAKDSWIRVDLDYDRYRIAGPDPDQRSLWISHFEAGKGFELQRYDPVTGAFAEAVWRDASYDLSRAELHFSRKTGKLVALRYDQRRHFTHCFEEPFVSAQKLVQRNFPAAEVQLSNYSDDESRLLYFVGGSRDPGRIVLLDLRQNSLEVLSEVAPWLQGRRFQDALPMGYTTRDGLKQEGYLTLPAGADAAHKVPLVVLVHSGPWLRVNSGFDPTVQFLASRGYAVLQPNYRGSTGYVPAISWDDRYAFKSMQEDIAAATRAAHGLEMIDSSRVAIMGQGFGGFLAMVGAAFEPGLYHAVVSLHGRFDAEQLVRDWSYNPASRAGYERLRDFLGKPGQDRDTFAAYSPLANAAKIKADVFLAYDENPDSSANDESRDLAAALKAQGTPCESFVLRTQLTDLRDLDANYEMYRKVDAFLMGRLGRPAGK